MKNLLIFLLFFTTTPLFATPQKVYSGIYLMNLYDLDMQKHTFYADFYVWFKWKGALDPTNIEFVNCVEKWGFTQTAIEDSTILLKNGYNYKSMRVEGRFYHPFEWSRFPLDAHKITIQMENARFSADSLVYVPDVGAAAMRKEFSMPGWNMNGCNLAIGTTDYHHNFGLTDTKTDIFSTATFTLDITRPWNYFLWKLMLPLAIVIFSSIGALLIEPTYIDARISLPIGGLLTTVFLQQSYSDALPDVGYMVLMDKIYLLSYVIIAAVMWQVMVAGNMVASIEADEPEKIRRREKILTMFFIGIFLVGSRLLVVLS
jgi:hypothetical protein